MPPEKAGNVELDDGWTFVGRSKGRRPLPPAFSATLAENQNAPTDPASSERVTRLIEEIEKASKRWKGSECAKGLSRSMPVLDFKVDRLICAGLGMMDPAMVLDNMRCIYQFAVFLWLKDILTSGDEKLKLYSQDPKFTPIDVAAQEHFGVKVSTKEDVTYETVPNTVLFAPYLPWSIFALQYLSKIKPLVCVCHRLDTIVENIKLRLDQGIYGDEFGGNVSREGMEQAIILFEEFLQDYKAPVFPIFEPHPHAFKGMTIYRRKQQPD